MTFVGQVANSAGWASDGQEGRQSSEGNASADGSAVGAQFLARNRRAALLNRVVEAEIIPRLALARGNPTKKPKPVQAEAGTTQDDTSELVRRLMGKEDDSAWKLVELLEAQGTKPAALYLGIISEAARRLGELWEEDRCDFAQVTISLGRLQRLVRALSPSFQVAAVSQIGHADTVMLLPAPGDQHTFGLVILAEFFQREGWNLIGGPVSMGYDAAELVRGAWVDVAGFSVGSHSRLESLAACIRAVRKSSQNRYLGVMVGGPLFIQHPELVTRVGADTTAPDAASAVRQAKGLLELRAAAD